MPRAKKQFDREDMYKKIMPTASRQEQEEVDEEFGENAEQEILEINRSRSKNFGKDSRVHSQNMFANKEIKWISESENETILFNITERMVVNRLDIALKKMRCCRCDRCKQDIISIALNGLTPHYVVCSSSDIESYIEKDEGLGLNVTSAILKAILLIRKNPRH